MSTRAKDILKRTGHDPFNDLKMPEEQEKAGSIPQFNEDAARRGEQRRTQRKYAKAGRAGTILTEGTTLG